MQEKTINNALLQLRREGGCVRTFAEAILKQRGVPCPPVRPYPVSRFKSRKIRGLVMDALRDGPKTGPEVVACIAPHAPDLPYDRLQNRVSSVLTRMRIAGLVVREGRLLGAKAMTLRLMRPQMLICVAVACNHADQGMHHRIFGPF